jgi:hypothetical protein
MLYRLSRVAEERFKFAIEFINNSKIEFLLALILGCSIGSFMVLGNPQFLVLCSSLLGLSTIKIVDRQRIANKYHKENEIKLIKD